MRKPDCIRSKIWWYRAALLLVLALVGLQGCATNYRGDFRYSRLAPSEGRYAAQNAVSDVNRQSAQEEMSVDQPSYERKSAASGRSSSYGNTNRPSDSPDSSKTKLLSDKSIGDLFDGPLVGFVAGNLLLRWSHPIIWLGAMALAVLIESEAMEYVRQVFFTP